MDDNKFLKEKIEIMSEKMTDMNEDQKDLQETVNKFNESQTFLTNNPSNEIPHDK